MPKYSILTVVTALAALWSTGCKKPNYEPTVTVADTTLTLKSAAPFPLGIGVSYDSMMNNKMYTAIVKEQFDNITAGYTMKHGAMVTGNGSLNFTFADNLVNAATQAGLAVYGHTLCWHQNNNGNYLRALLALPSSTPAANPNLLPDGTFEGGSGNSFTGWSAWNGGSVVSAGTGAGEMYQGARALKASPAVNGNPWDVQIVSNDITMVSGTSYRVRFYAKAATPGGKFRLSNNGGAAQYSGDYAPTTSWAAYEWTFSSNNALKKIVFDMGSTANTYYIDSVTVTLTNPGGAAATDTEKNYRIDTTLKNWITAMVTHYKDKGVKAWDVVNEPFKENGQYRNDVTSQSDFFPWWNYLGGGDSMIIKAFKHAHAADPAALLFLNEYNQEISTAKLDSMVAVVKRLKAQGVPIHGVGLQFHITINTPNTGIDNALLKLASTGLKVKITELDVRLNPGNTPNFVASPVMYAQQAARYRYVAESYYRNVPEAQRYGITVWGVTDKDSWLVTPTNIDYPLLYNATFGKKSAYYEFLTGLQLKDK
jgi:endo-1,4-beta-xylanase